MTQGGQAAFAAIQEIVALLDDDPATDWAKVDVDALRRHLVDMDAVTLRAQATAVRLPSGRRFEVTSSDPDVQSSIQRMVTAHVMAVSGNAGWLLAAEPLPNGAALTIEVADEAELARLDGLGFFGVLALEMHHQAHHLAIAQGRAPHP